MRTTALLLLGLAVFAAAQHDQSEAPEPTATASGHTNIFGVTTGTHPSIHPPNATPIWALPLVANGRDKNGDTRYEECRKQGSARHCFQFLATLNGLDQCDKHPSLHGASQDGGAIRERGDGSFPPTCSDYEHVPVGSVAESTRDGEQDQA